MSQPELKKALVIAHGYQPPREELGVFSGRRADHFAAINERITAENYIPMLVTPPVKFPNSRTFPDGSLTSIYGTLREPLRAHHPKEFSIIRKNLDQLPDREYKILGDSYLHPIFPLLSPKNQDMLVKIGLAAFNEDLGFKPRGFWLPETAVDSKTLEILIRNGIEFVTLRDKQLQTTEQNPMFVKIEKDGDVIGEIGIIHGNSELSGSLSFNKEVTDDAHKFLDSFSTGPGNTLAWMSDLEFYGHHQPFKDHFFYTVTDPGVLSAHQFEPFDVRKALGNTQRSYTEVKDKSSWSCDDELKRWTGEEGCRCDDWVDQREKKELRSSVWELGQMIDEQLRAISGPDWRSKFVDFFLATRRSMFVEGDIKADIDELAQARGMEELKNPVAQNYYLANMARWTAETSCIWFFGGPDRVERDIGRFNIREARQLLGMEQRMIAA